MRKQDFRIRARGSYTVEAAFIIPIIIGLSFVIMYVLFIFHDMVILQANLDNVIFLIAEEQISCKEADYNDNFKKSLWFMELGEIKMSENAMSVSGEITAKARVEIPVLSFFMDESQKFTLSESYSKVQPEQIKRWRR